MKKFKPLHLLLIGAVVVFIGGFLKIIKSDFYQITLMIGLVIELVSGASYLISNNKKVKYK